MTFEFLIACHMTPDSDISFVIEDIRQFLADTLAEILYHSQNDFDIGVIQIRHVRNVNQSQDMDGNILIGFAFELPEDTTDIESIVTDFIQELQDSPDVVHIVKFEDPLLQAELAERATEIFALEMKLRRVLSFIYLHAY